MGCKIVYQVGYRLQYSYSKTWEKYQNYDTLERAREVRDALNVISQRNNNKICKITSEWVD